MSNLGGDIQELVKLQTASKDREDRLKHAKERQKEERQKKIEELRAHAEAAQKYREQKEEERRRRMEEIKLKELEKRQLVEERKKAIIEAEKERREYILRKNQERVCRLEIKKKEQNTVGFAFGSSTPRLLEPATFGMVSPSIFWYNRRSTSISNVAGAALSRRSSERELSNIESRKRLTYATGNDEEKLPDVIFRSVARRKTDLMPTIPIRRDDYYSSRTSLSNTPKTQGRAYSLTRLDQLSQPVRHNGEHIRSILERQRNDNKPKKNMDQNFKNASSTWNSGISQSMTHLVEGRQRNTGSRSGNVTPKKSSSASRPSSAMSSSTIGISSNFTRRSANDGPKPRPASIAGTAVGLDEMKYAKKIMKSKSNNLSPVSHASAPKKIAAGMSNSFTTYSFPSEDRKNKPENDRAIASTTKSFNQRTLSTDHLNGLGKQTSSPNPNLNNTCPKEKTKHVSSKYDLDDGGNDDTVKTESIEIETSVPKIDTIIGNSKDSNQLIMNQSEDGEIGSTSAKSKITTEEEAKAALAERRRLAREEAERQAALERERIEAKRQMELLRQTAEAEAQRRFEEEAIRLAQEQREAEEKRLQLAIEEAQQKEDEEKRKREEEERQRLEREENDKKVKEEAERQRLEVDERLKREEKEREARRKRVEAIMSRTRKGTNMNSNSNKEESVNQQESTDLPYPLSRNENNISTADMTMTESFSILNNSNTDVNNLHLHTENLNSILSNLSINENLKNDQAEYQPENDKVKMSILQDELESSNNYFLPNSMAVVVTNGNNHIENLNKK